MGDDLWSLDFGRSFCDFVINEANFLQNTKETLQTMTQARSSAKEHEPLSGLIRPC
jgi:hypothetical protein